MSHHKLAFVLVMLFVAPAITYTQDIRNSDQATVAQIKSDGTIRNASDSYMGASKGVKREWAAACFFLVDIHFSHLHSNKFL